MSSELAKKLFHQKSEKKLSSNYRLYILFDRESSNVLLTDLLHFNEQIR